MQTESQVTKRHPTRQRARAASNVTLSRFIVLNSEEIIFEWAEFARTLCPAGGTMDLDQRRDHVAGMLKAIAADLETAQTRGQQAAKSKGEDDAHVDSVTAANSHGTERAAFGYTPAEMVSEFRALRASVLRLWSESNRQFSQADLQQVTRFNEAIDQLLAESIARYAQDVQRSKDLVLGVLGHDLRNPLGAIMMSAAALVKKEGPDSRSLRTATRILNSAARMEAMIRDLLDFTRSQLGGGIPVNRSEMNMKTVCKHAVDEITAYHPACTVHFEARGKLRGEWDSGRITQLLSNLVGNAYQHGAEDSVVDVSVHGTRDHVVLSVHNRGTVIPQRQLLDIFSPFRQLEPTAGTAKDPRSVGLGLYISEAIVKAHRGTIAVESNKTGTTFTVRLPRHSGDDALPSVAKYAR